MPDKQKTIPDNTAVRVALWRALHVQLDSAPHVLADEVGLQLANPDADWRQRPDMDPQFTRNFRASIVARARFVEDLVSEQADQGVTQYVFSVQVWTLLPSVARRSPRTSASLKSTSPKHRRGSGNACWTSVLASRSGCGSSRSTSRQTSPGWSS